MDLRIFTEPQQGASHADLLAVATATRAAGFSGFFRSDHLLTMGGDGLPGPSETFVSMAAIAALVPDIRLGTLVTSATFRHPSMTAIAAATLDDISGGRFDLGMGAGWFEGEHTAYGIDFGESFGERFDRLTEQLAIITGLWKTPIGSTFDFVGKYYTLAGAPGLPKPIHTGRDGAPQVPIVMGGKGPRRTPALAAAYADDFNTPFMSAEEMLAQFDRVRRACQDAGRDPSTMTFSTARPLCLGRDDAEVARRAKNIGRDLAELRRDGFTGTPAEVTDLLGRLGEAGLQRAYLQVLDLSDLDQIALAGAELIRA